MSRANTRYVGIRRGAELARGVAPRVVVGVALIAISLVSATAVLRSKASPVAVLVFAQEIDSGTRLVEADLVEAKVASSPKTLEHLVPASDRESIIGMRLLHPVRTGELVVRSAVSPIQLPMRVISLPVAPYGTSPDLVAGDVVDVVASYAVESVDARTVVVASSVPLVSLSPEAGEGSAPQISGVAPSGTESGRAIAGVGVRGDQLAPLVFAAQNGVISLVRSIPGEELVGQESSAFDPSELEGVQR